MQGSIRLLSESDTQSHLTFKHIGGVYDLEKRKKNIVNELLR